MKLTKVAVLLAAGLLMACADDGVRHTPDATPVNDGAVDALPDAPVAPAMLSGSPGATDFGDVVIGQTTSKVTYTISNDGDQTSGTLSVLVDPETAGFAITDNHCSGVALAMHETCTFAVAFTAPMAGAAMATIHVAASPGGELTRDLTGTGLQPGALDITEASHDFTRLAVDATPTTHTFTVKNTGQVATGIPAPSITGTANTYSVLSTTCTAALAPNATCNVVVKFDPVTVGSKPATLVVTGTPGGSDSATLSGTGIAHVAVTKTGDGTGMVTSNMTGIDCGSACGADFSATPVTLTAVPDTGVNFMGWTGACGGMSPCTLDLTAAKTVGAVFTKQRFVLTTSTTGTGSGTITGAGTYTYNQPVTVTATPATGSTFTGFNGDCTGKTCSLTMTTDHTVSANFDAIPETLTVSAGGAGGTIVSTPSGISCSGATCAHDFSYGTPVKLDAVLDPGYYVSVVGGDCTSLPCTVTMDQARSVRVQISQLQYTLALSFLGDGAGSVTVNGTTYTANTTLTFPSNTPLTLSESTAAGTTYVFGGWGGDCASSGTNTTCSYKITGSSSVSAAFYQGTHRYILDVKTATPNGLPFNVTYEPQLGASAECISSQTTTRCAGSLPPLTVVNLVAHIPVGGPAQGVWNTLPTWTNCDSVSADRMTCTFTNTISARDITVSGDLRIGP